MKLYLSRVALALLFCGLFYQSVWSSEGIYAQEMRAFLAQECAIIDDCNQVITDEMINGWEQAIVSDIESIKELSWFERTFFLLRAKSHFDDIVITPRTMPRLYAYIEGLCKANDMQVPCVFIANNNNFDAHARKILAFIEFMSIDRTLILKTTDKEIEAVIAHELGHIKYNHANKKTYLFLGVLTMLYPCFQELLVSETVQRKLEGMHPLLGVGAGAVLGLGAVAASHLLRQAIINKRFEKEADAFACASGKAEGIATCCKRFIAMKREYKQKITRIHESRYANKQNLSLSDYCAYYTACAKRSMSDAYYWLYYNTFLGDHLTGEACLQAAENYMKQEQA